MSRAFGLRAGRTGIRRVPRRAKRTRKGVKELLGEAGPEERAAHIEALLKPFAGVCDGEVIPLQVDEVHLHRDLDLGYTWGRRGERLWRAGDRPRRSDRMNASGAYDFTDGECLPWRNGRCDGERTVQSLRESARGRAGKPGRLVLIWDNAPRHVAEVVTAEAARSGIEVENLPGDSPDPNPIERLWDWMREGVTRGSCHGGVPQSIAACRAFIERIDRDPIARIDRLRPKFELDPEFEEKLRVST